MQVKFSDGSIMICGRIGSEPEHKTVGQSIPVTSFGVIVGKRDAGADKKENVWANCKCWRETAELTRGFKKNDRVLCVGTLDEFTDKDGKIFKSLNVEFAVKMPEMISEEKGVDVEISEDPFENLDGTPF